MKLKKITIEIRRSQENGLFSARVKQTSSEGTVYGPELLKKKKFGGLSMAQSHVASLFPQVEEIRWEIYEFDQ
jgi:hypothetical protein